MKSTNLLLGLLAVVGAGGAYFLYTENRKKTRGVEAISSGTGLTKWYYEQDDGTLRRADAIEIASFCSMFTNDSFGAQYRLRNAQILTSYGHADLALTCGSPVPVSSIPLIL